MSFTVATPELMEALGARFGVAATANLQLHLSGDLGAGKTTFVRGFLRGLGYRGTVKSPTYTLVEPYSFADFTVYHFDFYRVKEPNEIDAMGFRDYRAEASVCLIEWPEMAGDRTGTPDLLLRFDQQDNLRIIEPSALTDKGKLLISKLA